MILRNFENSRPVIEQTAYIDPAAVVIGDVSIGALSSVWPMCVIRGDIQAIRIGECSNIQDGSVLHVTHDSSYQPGGYPLIIGNNVTVGHQVTLHACTIGDNCLIGMGSVVLDAAVIEDGAMIGAGSLVNPGEKITGGYLWLGSPVKRIRALTDQEKTYLAYSATHYVNLARRHRKTSQSKPGL